MRALISYAALTKLVTGRVFLNYGLAAVRASISVLSGHSRLTILTEDTLSLPVSHWYPVNLIRML